MTDGPGDARPETGHGPGCGSPRRLRYPHAVRVVRKSQYAHIFGRGTSVKDALLKVVAVRRPGAGADGAPTAGAPLPTRMGTTVSKKIGDAVRRNRVRRRLREAFRLSRAELPAGLDLVVVPQKVTPEPAFGVLRRSLVDLARKVERRLANPSRQPPAAAPDPTTGGAPTPRSAPPGEPAP